MKNWRTTIGGAVSVLGTSLIAGGILPQLNGAPSKLLTYTAFTGFVLSCVGKFLTALFAADAAQVKSRMDQIDAHLQSTDSIAAEIK